MKRSKITQELKRISKINGGILKPEAVVRIAKNKNNVLHDYFEWDNEKAGHNYRVWQARQLIAVSVEYSETTQQSYDVFVSLSKDRINGGYRQVEQVLSNETLRQIMLSDALSEMNLFIEKYNKLKELAQVFEVMTMTTSKYSQKHKKGVKNYIIHPATSIV